MNWCKTFVQLDAAIWADPDAVIGVEPGAAAHMARVHLVSGAVLAVRIGPDRLCTSQDHLVDRLVSGMRAVVRSGSVSRYYGDERR